MIVRFKTLKLFSNLNIINKNNFDEFLIESINIDKKSEDITKSYWESIKNKYKKGYIMNLNKENIKYHYSFMYSFFNHKNAIFNSFIDENIKLDLLNYNIIEEIIKENIFWLKFKNIKNLVINNDYINLHNFENYLYFIYILIKDYNENIPNINEIFHNLTKYKILNNGEIILLIKIAQTLDNYDTNVLITNFIFNNQNYSNEIIYSLFDFFGIIMNIHSSYLFKFILWLNRNKHSLNDEILIKSFEFVNNNINNNIKEINDYCYYIWKKDYDFENEIRILANLDIHNKISKYFNIFKSKINNLINNIFLETEENKLKLLGFISNFRLQNYFKNSILNYEENLSNILTNLLENNENLFNKENIIFYSDNGGEINNLEICLLYNKIRYLFKINNLELKNNYDNSLLKILENNIDNLSNKDLLFLLLNNENDDFDTKFYNKLYKKLSELKLKNDLDLFLSIIRLFEKNKSFKSQLKLKEILEDVIIKEMESFSEISQNYKVKKVFNINIDIVFLIDSFDNYKDSINFFEEKFLNIISKLIVFCSYYNFGSFNLFFKLSEHLKMYLDDLFKTKKGILLLSNMLPYINKQHYSNPTLMININNNIINNSNIFYEMSNSCIIQYIYNLVLNKSCCNTNWVKFENYFKNKKLSIKDLLNIVSTYLIRKKYINDNFNILLSEVIRMKDEIQGLNKLYSIIVKLNSNKWINIEIKQELIDKAIYLSEKYEDNEIKENLLNLKKSLN